MVSAGRIGWDGTLYIPSEDYYLYAFCLDGTVRWKYKTGWTVRYPPAIGIGKWEM